MEPPELAAHLKTLDVSIEDVITAARLLAEEDRDGYVKGQGEHAPNDLVVHCIEACIQHLSDASMAIYASYK